MRIDWKHSLFLFPIGNLIILRSSCSSVFDLWSDAYFYYLNLNVNLWFNERFRAAESQTPLLEGQNTNTNNPTQRFPSEISPRRQKEIRTFDVFEAYFDSSLDAHSHLSNEAYKESIQSHDVSSLPAKGKIQVPPFILSFLLCGFWLLFFSCAKYTFEVMQTNTI